MLRHRPETIFLVIAAVAAVALAHALALPVWGRDETGPGLFPRIIATVCLGLALATFLVSACAAKASSEGEDEEAARTMLPAGTDGRRRLAVYLLAVALLPAAALYGGMTAAALLTSVLIVTVAERGSWVAGIAYGVLAASGFVLFAGLLKVDLPQGPVESLILPLLRW